MAFDCMMYRTNLYGTYNAYNFCTKILSGEGVLKYVYILLP